MERRIDVGNEVCHEGRYAKDDKKSRSSAAFADEIKFQERSCRNGNDETQEAHEETPLCCDEFVAEFAEQELVGIVGHTIVFFQQESAAS